MIAAFEVVLAAAFVTLACINCVSLVAAFVTLKVAIVEAATFATLAAATFATLAAATFPVVVIAASAFPVATWTVSRRGAAFIAPLMYVSPARARTRALPHHSTCTYNNPSSVVS